MDIEKLMQMIIDTKYYRDGTEHNIFFREGEKLAIEKTIRIWASEQQSKMAELEAKCYTYEKIIANSNFAPLLKGVVSIE